MKKIFVYLKNKIKKIINIFKYPGYSLLISFGLFMVEIKIKFHFLYWSYLDILEDGPGIYLARRSYEYKLKLKKFKQFIYYVLIPLFILALIIKGATLESAISFSALFKIF